MILEKNEMLPFVELRYVSGSEAKYHCHSHDEFSFGVIDSGSAIYENMKENNLIGAGATVTINPGDIHSCNPKNGKWSYRMLFVNAKWVGDLQKDIFKNSNSDYQVFSQHLINDRTHYEQFSKLFEYLKSGKSALKAESLLIQFLSSNLFSSKLISNKSDKSRLKQVKDLLMDCLNQNLSLDELSKHSGLSRFHLIRSFKENFGLTPHAFQIDQRIKRAKELLKKGHDISEISYLLGFNDQSHFQRHFKKRLAMTPKKYQSAFL